MLIVIIRNQRTIVFYIVKITILRNTLCSWVTNTDIMRSQEVLRWCSGQTTRLSPLRVRVRSPVRLS